MNDEELSRRPSLLTDKLQGNLHAKIWENRQFRVSALNVHSLTGKSLGSAQQTKDVVQDRLTGSAATFFDEGV